MNKGTQKFLSFALASTLVAGLPAVAHAEGNNSSNGEEATIEETIASSRTYIVQAGDTLGRIAERFYGNAALYEQLARVNNIKNPDLIFPGQIITIPRDLTVAYDYQNNEAVVVPAYEEERTYTTSTYDTQFYFFAIEVYTYDDLKYFTITLSVSSTWSKIWKIIVYSIVP